MCYPLKIEKEYRAAVALNNIGVTLLTHHHYSEASKTFRDTVELLTSLARVDINGTGQKDTAIDVERTKKIEAALQDGYKRSSLVVNVVKKMEETRCQIVQVSSQTHFGQLPKEHVRDEKFAVHFCINIDPVANEDWYSHRFDLDASIVLFNYGISQMCGEMGRSRKKATSSRDLGLEAILAVLLKAEFLLSRIHARKCKDFDLWLLVSGLVGRSILYFLRKIDAPQSEEYSKHYQQILSMIDTNDNAMIAPIHLHGAAPAA